MRRLLPELGGSMIVIHYGSKIYDPLKVKKIKNDDRNKPIGGLWTSPINSEFGWIDWCRCEEYTEYEPENSFKLLILPESNIYKIDSFQDLLSLPLIQKTYMNKMVPDFEIIQKTIDAIWLTIKGENETRLASNPDLYGWDCESVLIMNPDCCRQIL